MVALLASISTQPPYDALICYYIGERRLSIMTRLSQASVLLSAIALAAAATSDCTCTLLPQGRGRDDAPAIIDVLRACSGNGSTVCFPAPYVYTIGTAMETFVEDVTIRLEGTFQFTNNISYWVNNRYAPLAPLCMAHAIPASDIPSLASLLNFRTKYPHGASTARISSSMMATTTSGCLMGTDRRGTPGPLVRDPYPNTPVLLTHLSFQAVQTLQDDL